MAKKENSEQKNLEIQTISLMKLKNVQKKFKKQKSSKLKS